MPTKKKPRTRERHLYIKFLGHSGQAVHGGYGTWLLPKNGKPGAWMPRTTAAIHCIQGYHGCNPADCEVWEEARAFVMEYETKPTYEQRKSCGRRARLLAEVPTLLGKASPAAQVKECRDLIDRAIAEVRNYGGSYGPDNTCANYLADMLDAGIWQSFDDEMVEILSALEDGDIARTKMALDGFFADTCMPFDSDEDEPKFTEAQYKKAIEIAKEKFPWKAPKG